MGHFFRGRSGSSRSAVTPPVVAPPPGNPRFPLFDALRAIAALSVVAIHSTVYTGYFVGWEGALVRQLASGVTVFFLISGFLLYRPFVAARLGGRPQIPTADYARRRILRIVPAYWLALTVLALFPGLPGHPLSGVGALTYFGFAQDYRDSTLFNGLGTAWSLGTEVTFYAFLPVYAFVLNRVLGLRRLRTAVTVEMITLLALSVGSLGFRYLEYADHPNLAYTLPGTFDWFALGMALAVASVVYRERKKPNRLIALIERRPSLCWVCAAGAFAAAAAYFMRTSGYDAYSAGPLHILWGLFALFLLLPAAFAGARRGVPGRVLSWRGLGWLGIVSYGIYLWHLPLVKEVGSPALDLAGISSRGALATAVVFCAVAAVTVACAATSYYVVERPLLRFKSLRSRKPAVEPVTSSPVPAQAGP